MTVFTSWLATMGFFAIVFGIGLVLQKKERQNKITRRVSEAIYDDLTKSARAAGAAAGAQSWEASTFGTRYGMPTNYERQRRA